MTRLKYNLDTIIEFNNNVDNSLDNLLNMVKEMKVETNNFKDTGTSKTLTVFNNFMEKELDKKEKLLLFHKNKYNELFSNGIIPKYEELYIKTNGRVGKDG